MRYFSIFPAFVRYNGRFDNFYDTYTENTVFLKYFLNALNAKHKKRNSEKTEVAVIYYSLANTNKIAFARFGNKIGVIGQHFFPKGFYRHFCIRTRCFWIFIKINLIKTKIRNNLCIKTINGTILAAQNVKLFDPCVNCKPSKDVVSILRTGNIYDDKDIYFSV